MKARYSRSSSAEAKKKMQKKRLGYIALGVLVVLAFLLVPTLLRGNNQGNDQSADTANRSDLTIASHQAVPEENEHMQIAADQAMQEADQSLDKPATSQATGIAETEESLKAQDKKVERKNLDKVPENEVPMTKPVVSYNEGEKIVFLTIDDGPSASSGKLLDILKNYNVPATFFMLEPNMWKYPDAVVRLVEEGHMPGMHGVTHNQKIVYASSESVVDEMLQGQTTIKELTGVTSPLFRPPYGSKPHMKPEYKAATDQAGLIMWDWNVDSLDWKYKSAKYVSHTIEQVQRLTAKGVNPVILIHDRKETAASLPQLLDYLLENGYTFKLIDSNIEPVQFK